MKSTTKKYLIQGPVAYPHIGKFLANYFGKYNVNRNELARQINVANSTTTSYVKQESLQLGILWKISLALKHNFLADLALLLPIPFKTPREKELENQLQELQQEISELKTKNKIYKNLITEKQN